MCCPFFAIISLHFIIFLKNFLFSLPPLYIYLLSDLMGTEGENIFYFFPFPFSHFLIIFLILYFLKIIFTHTLDGGCLDLNCFGINFNFCLISSVWLDHILLIQLNAILFCRAQLFIHFPILFFSTTHTHSRFVAGLKIFSLLTVRSLFSHCVKINFSSTPRNALLCKKNKIERERERINEKRLSGRESE